MLAYRKLFSEMFEEIRKVVIGQDRVVEQLTVALLSDGNALLEGYPGLAKTLTAQNSCKTDGPAFQQNPAHSGSYAF